MSLKRVCLPFEKDAKPFDVFITRKTNFAAQIKRCRKLLDTKFDNIRIQATGAAIPRAFRLVTVLNDCMKNTVNIDVKTTTLLARDVIDDGKLLQERCVSAVVIRVSRILVA